VGFGFVARFSQNNTFRPPLAVTREQLVSLVLESFQRIQGANIAVLKKVRYALCPMPYARRVPHLSEKGYITFPSNLSIRLYSEVDISR